MALPSIDPLKGNFLRFPDEIKLQSKINNRWLLDNNEHLEDIVSLNIKNIESINSSISYSFFDWSSFEVPQTVQIE